MKIISAGIAEPITLEQARKQCKVDASGSPPTHEDDDLIAIFATAAREWCEAYLGLQIRPSVAQLSFSSFTDVITLEGGPIASINSINYLDADGIELAVNPLTYELDTSEQVGVIRLLTDQAWPSTNAANDNIKVLYSLGYSAAGDSPQDAALPASVKTAILLLVGHLYRNRESTVDQALSIVPMGVTFFLSPFKLRRGFA